ncbi:MAG TPA: amidohydrolase family protein, partial [Salinimicrobium sp.]|nr:amidohydrolase family protein [Salinimicrobium sp.]
LKFLICILLCASFQLQAQIYFPENAGVKADKNTNYTVFKNAKIHVSPSETIENGMFSIRDGKITAIGKSISIPENSVVIDLSGKEVYPSFIDIFTSFGIEKPEEASGESHYGPSREGYYWNDHIRPETTALENFDYSGTDAEKLRKMGFGVVNTHVPDAIIRGSGMLVALNSEGDAGDRILDEKSAQYLSFEKSEKSKQFYPTSIMGAMALLRQTYLDAAWYAKGNIENKDLALEALNENKNLVQIFKAGNFLNEFRADKVGDEFDIQYVILGTGMEFKKPEAIKATEATFILPLNFPKPYDLENPYLANFIGLEEMKTWNQAPTNLSVMAKNEVPFALTTFNSEENFKENLLKAIAYGLPKETALAALTTVPAKILGKENTLGTLKEGAWANFIITSGDYFDKETTLFENWVQGERTIIEDMSTVDIKGTYELQVAGNTYSMEISGEPAKPKAEITLDSTKIGSKITYDNNWLTLLLSSPDTTKAEFTRLIAKIPDNPEKFNGKAILTDGTETSFFAIRTGALSEETKQEKSEKKDSTHVVLPITFPNKAYGFKTLPEQQDILFTNATVWTNEEEGILKNTDVRIEDGKIAAVGINLEARGAKIIDATGKHLTTGIIDEHSHIAASDINEAGHNSSAEVSMEDAIDPTDINIYRNLAGGVTTIQLLHGSANPIGG